MGYFVQISSLIKYIEKTLLTTKNAEAYTFNIINKTEKGKLIYSFPKADNKLKYIKADEIFRLFAMAETFSYRGDAMSKVKFMLKLVIFGGLSGTELAHLTKYDIKIVKNPHHFLEGLYLELQVKHPKKIVIYIKYSLVAEEYSAYNLEYHRVDSEKSYFYTEKGKIYSSSSIYQQFDRLMEHADISIDNSTTAFLKYGYAIFLASNDVYI